jgi:hypothetical protein
VMAAAGMGFSERDGQGEFGAIVWGPLRGSSQSVQIGRHLAHGT